MSFLHLYDSKTLLKVDSNMLNLSLNLTEKTDSCSTSSDSGTVTPITSLYQAEMSTTPSSEGSVALLPTELKESYDKYYEELESERFEDILDSLKREWDYAVLRVLDLYTVKYNHQRG